jgi:hypothetical protein
MRKYRVKQRIVEAVPACPDQTQTKTQAPMSVLSSKTRKRTRKRQKYMKEENAVKKIDVEQNPSS